MTLRRLTVCFGLSAALWVAEGSAREQNDWPGPVTQTDVSGQVTTRDILGPLIFEEPSPSGGRIAGVRPFYVRKVNAKGETEETTVLYPIFYYRTYGDMYEWSVFKLINRFGRSQASSPDPQARTFDIWPVYFSRNTGDPATSNWGLLPLYGSEQGYIGYDRLSWVLFPLYAQARKGGATTTFAPWPFIRVSRGSEKGFAIWPLYGNSESARGSRREYFVWPLAWNNTIAPAADSPAGTQPTRQFGILPFFTSTRGPGLVDENFAWPFFGYTDRVSPAKYHETRYFWPFFVQGDGESQFIHQWAPVYSHSLSKGVDKTWYFWPFFRRTSWVDGAVAQERIQGLYFLFWRQEQRDVTRPQAAPAVKTYLWPLVTAWDNGAGRRQVQVLSPLEGVFADNPRIRDAWSPLFALWRYDQQAPGESRGSLLWNAVTWKKSERENRSEFHLGPLIALERGPASSRVSLAGGLLGFVRPAVGNWRPFCWDFHRSSPQLFADSTQ